MLDGYVQSHENKKERLGDNESGEISKENVEMARAYDDEREGRRAMGIEVQDKKRNGRPKRG